MSKLLSLALAAEARGRAQETLDRARRQTEQLRAEFEAQARELVDAAGRAKAIAAKPGDQLQLPISDASWATRAVLHQSRGRFAR